MAAAAGDRMEINSGGCQPGNEIFLTLLLASRKQYQIYAWLISKFIMTQLGCIDPIHFLATYLKE